MALLMHTRVHKSRIESAVEDETAHQAELERDGCARNGDRLVPAGRQPSTMRRHAGNFVESLARLRAAAGAATRRTHSALSRYDSIPSDCPCPCPWAVHSMVPNGARDCLGAKEVAVQPRAAFPSAMRALQGRCKGLPGSPHITRMKEKPLATQLVVPLLQLDTTLVDQKSRDASSEAARLLRNLAAFLVFLRSEVGSGCTSCGEAAGEGSIDRRMGRVAQDHP